MNTAENPRINGMIIQAHGICTRQVWLLAHSIFADQTNEYLALGRLIDQNSYAREKHQVTFGDNRFDFMDDKSGTLVISEIKKSSRAEKASRLQLAHYLYELEKEGITAKGVLLYPKEKKRTEVLLSDELREELERVYADIRKISAMPVPPALQECRYCAKCAYAEYCWG